MCSSDLDHCSGLGDEPPPPGPGKRGPGLLMEFKGCPKPIGYVTIDGNKKPVACMKWTCPYCGPIKKHRLACRISRGFSDADTVIAITLTQKLHSKRNILKDFETVRYLLKTRHSIIIDRYFWVKEFTKKGQRHVHILCSTYIDHKLLKIMVQLN